MESQNTDSHTSKNPIFDFKQFQFGFQQKAWSCLLLALLADFLFYKHEVGWTMGLFTALLLVFFLVFNPRVLNSWHGKLSAWMLTGLSLACMIAPHLMSGYLILVGFGTLVQLLVLTRLDDALHWLVRGVFHAWFGWIKPAFDLYKLLNIRKKWKKTACNLYWIFPLGLSALFIYLFAQANPVISQWLDQIDWTVLMEYLSIPRLFFIGVMGILVWAILRPFRAGLRWQAPKLPEGGFSLLSLFFSQQSLFWSLALFNVIFLVQNGLDITYLWGGFTLPDGMTYAEYAHRGAYPLIATALLAGAFVLITLRPGSESESHAGIRAMVYLWIAQNIFLTVSTILRTMEYIEIYTLTQLRLAAMIWMGLVALGLFWVMFRIFTRKSNQWLIQVNLVSLATVLYICCFLDLRGLIAEYNVDHSLELSGKGQVLDLNYFQRELGEESIPALSRFDLTYQTQDHQPKSKMAGTLVSTLCTNVRISLDDWRGWTLRRDQLARVCKERIKIVEAPSKGKQTASSSTPPAWKVEE